MSRVKNSIFALSIALFVASWALINPSVAALKLKESIAEDWSQFRGPNGSGVSATTNLPVEFGPTKNVVWKTALPPGHSSPVLTSNRIFVTAFSKEDASKKDSAGTKKNAPANQPANTKEKERYKLLVICLDRQTGKLLWQREVPRLRMGRLQNVNGPASPSPVTDGSNVYAFFQEVGGDGVAEHVRGYAAGQGHVLAKLADQAATLNRVINWDNL